jgi:programmed cell death protein 5
MNNQDDIDEIRKKKLQELQQQQNQEQPSQEELDNQEKDRGAMLKHLLRKILTSDARKRLTNVRLVDEEKASKVEKYLLTLAKQDKLANKVTEEQIKQILQEVTEDKSFNIKGMGSRTEN